jgi:protein-tyrosine phosphatase
MHNLVYIQDIAYDQMFPFEKLCFKLFQHLTKWITFVFSHFHFHLNKYDKKVNLYYLVVEDDMNTKVCTSNHKFKGEVSFSV